MFGFNYCYLHFTTFSTLSLIYFVHLDPCFIGYVCSLCTSGNLLPGINLNVKNERSKRRMRHASTCNPLPGFPQLPCSAGTPTPFPLLLQYLQGEICKGNPLPVNCLTLCVTWMKAATPQMNWNLLSVFAFGTKKQHSNHKPQSTSFPPPPPILHPKQQTDAIPWGQLSG